MIEYKLNGSPLPDLLTIGYAYRIAVWSGGVEVTPTTWSVTTPGPVTVASGASSFIEFTPEAAVAHTLTVRVIGAFGLFQTYAKTVNILARAGAAESGVNWKKLVFVTGENIKAKITARDINGLPPSSIAWTLFRNGYAVLNGSGADLNYTGTMLGLYRLRGVAYCFDGTQLLFDSNCFVSGSVNVKHSLPIPDYQGTAVYVGAVFTQDIPSSPGVATSLPYQEASSTEIIYLLPGTTHWMFDVDPASSLVEDEVVVRTKKGNWCLNGFSDGLTGENIGYDYGYMPVMIPAPVDHRLELTADFFKLHDLVYSGFTTRIRIKCYRVLTQGIYRYERCAYSSHPGGEGRRSRRWAALFTSVSVETDALSGLNRLGTGSVISAYTTISTTSVPLMTLSTSGTPNPVPGYSGLFYTDSNIYAYYEAAGQFDIAAKAVSAIENVRPCCISLLMFNKSKPVISNRIKRIYGKLVVFLTDGAVIEGSVVNLSVKRSDSVNSTSYSLPVTATSYVNEDDTLLSIGEIDVDLSDYQFDETGLVVDFTVDETGAVDSALPISLPTPVTSQEFIYSSDYSRTVLFDGACYVNPVFVSVLDDSAVVVTAIGGCQDPACGPSALYCYASVDAPAQNIVVPQPFGFPAPFVSFGSNPSRCYQSPTVLAETSGTQTTIQEFSGSQSIDLWSFTYGSYCGASYIYNDCQTNYAPCYASSCSIIVVYPVSSSPHSNVEYGGRCFFFSGTSDAYGTRAIVPVSSVNPVVDCYDPVCNQYNASGSVVVYNDAQSLLETPVRFENIDIGIPQYGAAPKFIDDGLLGIQAGQKTITFSQASVLVYTAPASGTLMLDFGMSGIRKKVVVTGALPREYNPGTGGTRSLVTLQTGDKVYLRIADAYGRLPRQYKNLRVSVKWEPVLSLPRLFDTVVVPYSGSTAINALGFCSYINQGNYTFYGTIPFNGAMSGPVNPDSIVTVTSGSQEYNLITARSTGDTHLFPLSDVPLYSGQTLSGPLTFKFYAAREAFGGHGEMDVWFDTNGTFPGYLTAGNYESVYLSGTYYRKDSSPTDTNRNSYVVASSAAAAAAKWPNVYVASDGQVISAISTAGTVTVSGKAFVAPDYPNILPDSGLSQSISSI